MNPSTDALGGTVYRLYDKAGVLLYIGSTTNLEHRMICHLSSRWQCSESLTLHERFGSVVAGETFATLTEAREAEKAAIREEAPLLNKIHNPKRWRKVPVTNQWVPVELVSA